jgi:hypothetical protein
MECNLSGPAADVLPPSVQLVRRYAAEAGLGTGAASAPA